MANERKIIYVYVVNRNGDNHKSSWNYTRIDIGSIHNIIQNIYEIHIFYDMFGKFVILSVDCY